MLPYQKTADRKNKGNNNMDEKRDVRDVFISYQSLSINIVNTKTGVLSDNGEYLHGTRYDKKLLNTNRHLTHGCTRLFNRDALYVINDILKIGDYLMFVE